MYTLACLPWADWMGTISDPEVCKCFDHLVLLYN